MQLTRKGRRRLRRTLFVSTCALLGTDQNAMADKGDWSLDSGLLYYSEADRVRAVEPALMVKRDLGGDAAFNARLVVDSLTGATPTGAMASSRGASVTSASGSVSVSAGVLPMNDKFKDLRRAVSMAWSRPFSRLWRADLSGNYSLERDFRSAGANALVARDFNRRNTTLSLGASYESDTVIPIGGIPLPFGAVPGAGDGPETPIARQQNKTVKGGLAGLTQVMSRYWIVELNYSYSQSQGYLSDPYKVVSILNTHLGGLGVFPFPFGPAIGDPLQEIHESRPDTRHERAVFMVNKVYAGGGVVDFSWRYGRDDWGIRAHSYELRYRLPFGDGYFLQPHLRYYHQSAADFYQRALLDTDTLPNFVSADYRLADINGRTLGVELGTDLQDQHSLRLRLERYVQSGKVDPRVLVGVQANYNSFPDLTAYIAQLSYSF